MRHLCKRVLAHILCITLCIGLLQFGARADEPTVRTINNTSAGIVIKASNTGVEVTTIPVLVSAIAAPGQITVQWNTVANATKYAVYRKTASGSWTLLTTTVTGTSYVDKSAELVAGTVYYYTVKSLVSGAWSSYDGKGVSATAVASTTPVLKSATSAAGQITVQWNAVANATKYAVYRKTASGSWTLLTTSVTGTSYVDKSTDLVAGTVYYYTVKSLVSGAWSGYDAKGVSATAIASTTPILKSATAAAGQITVQWNTVTNATKYAVYRKTAGGNWTLLTTSVTGISYVDKSADLVAGTVYYYTVKSLVSGAWSGYDGKGVSATAIASTTPVLKSATAAAGQITVQWNAVANAAKYAVYRKTASGNWTLLTTAVTGTSYVDKSAELVPGTTYYYTVKSLVNGTWSGYDGKGVSATAVAAASTTPILVSATASVGQIRVQWNAVANATKYAVYRKTAGVSWTLLTTSVTGTSYVDKSAELVSGTVYYYTVKSLVNGNWSGYDAKGVSATAASITPVLKSATASSGQITVQWNAVSGASKYAVYRKTVGGNWTLLTTSATGTSYPDKSSDLKAGTTYYYTVKAYVGGAWSGYDSKGVGATAIVTALDAEQIYAKCSPAVFYIEVANKAGEVFASGSGFFISGDGTAVTNYHVIDGAYSATIALPSGAEYRVLGVYDYNEDEDWAILKINGSGFSYLDIGDASTVVGGAKCYAIGSPQGLQNTISEGIISNPAQDLGGMTFIQISAAISHGSSGGALLNKYGQVIGITSKGFEEGENLGFAIPISRIAGYSHNQYFSLSELFPGSSTYEISPALLAYAYLATFVSNNYNDVRSNVLIYAETEITSYGNIVRRVQYDPTIEKISIQRVETYNNEQYWTTITLYPESNIHTVLYTFYNSLYGIDPALRAYSYLYAPYFYGNNLKFTNIDVNTGYDVELNESFASGFLQDALSFTDYVFYKYLSSYGNFGVYLFGFTNYTLY